jgi:hypothetical protein
MSAQPTSRGAQEDEVTTAGALEGEPAATGGPPPLPNTDRAAALGLAAYDGLRRKGYRKGTRTTARTLQ